MFRQLISIFCLWCLSYNLPAAQRYQSAVEEAKWALNASPVTCELVHEISHYGDARFVFSAGGELAFQLRVLHESPRDSVASLHSIAPFWHEPYEKEIAQLTISKGKMPVYVGGKLALRMLYELQAGHHPTFHYRDWADAQDDVYVSVSSVNFHQQLDGFQRCMNGALSYGSDKVKDAVVNFAVNKSILSKSQRKKLKEIALFAKTDKSMEIQLNGHADGQGSRRYNQKLSARRTKAVEKYLMKLGVPSDQISLKSFGEGRPVGSNRSEHGRSNNRRVDVVIKRN